MTPWLVFKSWFRIHRLQLLCGLVAGASWGLLTGGGATPRVWLALDVVHQVVIVQRPDLAAPITLSVNDFMQSYMTNLIEVTLTFLVLCSVAGWVAWQLVRIRPRGQPQPRLGEDWDVYVLAFLLSGLGAALLFQELYLGNWFKGPQVTPADVITGLIGFLLPLVDGVGAFMVWFLRLESVRAPDWETHFPPPPDYLRPVINRLRAMFRPNRKGGKESD